MLSLVAVWIGVTVTDRSRPSALGASPRPGSSSTPSAVDARGTPPPLVEALPRAPTAPVPVFADFPRTLAWLVPRSADLRSVALPSAPPSKIPGQTPDHAPRWFFVGADGSAICACTELGLPESPGNVLHLSRYDPTGVLVGEVAIPDWPVAVVPNRTLADAAIDPTGQAIYVVSAMLGGDGWSVLLDRFAANGPPARASIVVATGLDEPEPGFSADVRLWIASDGSVARIRLAAEPQFEDAPSALTNTWTVPISHATFGIAEHVARAPGTFVDPRCFAEGWATPVDFVTLCSISVPGQDNDALVVRVVSADGSANEVRLGPAGWDFGWLIDGSAGLVYLWAPDFQHLYRVEVPSLRVSDRELPIPARPLGPIVLEAAPPQTLASRTAWQPRPLARPNFDPVMPSSLAGAPDGTIIYAAGFDRPSDLGKPADPFGQPVRRSTGVWLLDSTTLAIVGHWLPVADYTALGLTPGGRFLMASGPASIDAEALSPDAPSVLAFHDVVDGVAVLVIRKRTDPLGWPPQFVVPGPYP